MWLFYVLAALPLLVGFFLWVYHKEVTWWEWVVPALISFVLAGIFHVTIETSLTRDYETWSGQVHKVVHYPRWVEQYTAIETYTDSKGRMHTRTVTRTRVHHEHWRAYDTLGRGLGIGEEDSDAIAEKFGGYVTTLGSRGGMVSGDKNDYVADNKTGYCVPVTNTYSWRNVVRAAPNLFQFVEVPDGYDLPDYPPNPSDFESGRLVGDAKKRVGLYQWDCMNARVGPATKVNVVLVGFQGQDSSTAQYLEAKWFGGKKNDLVLCYGTGIHGKVLWSYVFGWTEEAEVKRNLESLLLTKEINQSIIPEIEKEIRANYVIKDWSKFEYITLQPPMWTYFLFLCVMIASQVAAYWLAINNTVRSRSGL